MTVNPAICSRSVDPYSLPVSVLRSCGDRIWPLLHIRPVPGGGRLYDYGAYTWIAPPAHFNALAAPDKQLTELGLPTRARLGRQWLHVIRHFRHFIQPPPYLVELSKHKNAPAYDCNTGNCIWAGHYVKGHTYNNVTGTWTEPTFKGAGCSGDEFSQWGGLGGVGSGTGSLAQTGTAFNEAGLAAHQGFIETIIGGIDPGPTAISGFLPPSAGNPGDTIYVSVLWDSSLNVYSYLLDDWTTNKSSGSIFSRTDNLPDNSTAEIISERPGGSNPTELSDFQTVAVQNATSYWSSGSAGFYHNPQHYSLIMYNSSGDVLATTNNLDSNSNFTNTWKQCS